MIEPDFKNIFQESKEVLTGNIRKTNNTLTLHDLVKHYKNKEIVGEESLVCAMTLAAINNSSFGVEGFSGSGKTYIVDKLIELLPDVYKIQQSSELAIFNIAEKINGSKYIYIPELQKAMQNRKSPIIEVIKDLTEGKDSNRIVTRRKGSGVKEFSIKSGVTIIYTLAVENYFKKDEESSRRLIRLRTDASETHLEEIHEYKAKKRYSIRESEENKKALENKVKEHLRECIEMDDVRLIDPFSNQIMNMIPKTQKSVGYIDHYYSLLDGSAKFNFNNRKKANIDGKTYLLVNLEDHYNVYQIYFKEFIQTLKDLENEDENLTTEYASIQEPEWVSFFCSGDNILRESSQLEQLRLKIPSIVDEWYNSQVCNGILEISTYYEQDKIMIPLKQNEA
ncbi:MAG: ATP-binding protein [Nanoarchaeota archaeon]|nr:ATP-binding protein [Nanoarchaeota archaeon]